MEERDDMRTPRGVMDRACKTSRQTRSQPAPQPEAVGVAVGVAVVVSVPAAAAVQVVRMEGKTPIPIRTCH